MNEHNPITIRLDEMATAWKKIVRPQHRLIRWMLRPEESRMYEGFCRLEASPHGKLDNLFVFFYTPFVSFETYSFELIKNWLREFDDKEQQPMLSKAAVTGVTGVAGEWDLSVFKNAVASENYAACDELLSLLIESYRTRVGLPQTSFVLSLLPKQLNAAKQFLQWMERWMERPQPTAVQLLVFDHADGNYWGEVFEKYREEAVTLQHDLRMQEAIRQIATAGSATDPYALFRKCLFEMGDAATKKNAPLLHAWGEKAIEAGKKSGDKNLLATAYITYAGMLFSFSDHLKIGQLLDMGMRLCKQAIAAGNDSLKPLLLQYYTYKGADCQVQKERKDAFLWFMKAGDEAVNFGFAAQAVSAYYKAYLFADYKKLHKEKTRACQSAMQLTDQLTDEEVQASEYPLMAYEFLRQQEDDQADEWKDRETGKLRGVDLKKKVEEKMLASYDTDWMETVEALRQNYTRKKLRQAEKELPH